MAVWKRPVLRLRPPPPPVLSAVSKKNPRGESAPKLKCVRNTFEDVEGCIGIFEPLILEEVNAQIVQGNDADSGFLEVNAKIVQGNDAYSGTEK